MDENTEEIQIDKNKKKKKTIFTDLQIAKIKEIYNSWQSSDTSTYADVPELCKAVHLNDPNGIKAMNYSLAPSKYIEFINHDTLIDVDPMMQDLLVEMKRALEEERKTIQLLEMAVEEV